MLKKNNIFVLLFILVSIFSCVKDEGISDSEQAKIDNEVLLDYFNTHTLKISETIPNNNINWEIVEAIEGDENLSSIAVLDSSTTSGVVYYYWYIEVSKGGNVKIDEVRDLMVVDFNEFLLDGTKLSSSYNENNAIELEIKSRVKGVQSGLKYFLTGVISINGENNYRGETELPGKGILFFPSGLGYKEDGSDKISHNKPIRVDLVLYDKINFPEEE